MPRCDDCHTGCHTWQQAHILEALELFHINIYGCRVSHDARNRLPHRRDCTHRSMKYPIAISTHSELYAVSLYHFSNITLVDVRLDTKRGQILDLDERTVAACNIANARPTADSTIDRGHNACMWRFED